MMPSLILVIDDEPSVRRLLRTLFEDGGFAVEEAGDGASALRLIKSREPALVTLDLQLGRDDGLELAREIRQLSKVPIVMVTARGDVIDRVVGLEIGADDYITKPFHVREVLARVRSVLRRTEDDAPDNQDETTPAYRFDGLTAVPSRFELLDRDGAACDMTATDFRMLSVFLERPGKILSRDRLMDLTDGTDRAPLDRTIDNRIARLRQKIERDPHEPKLIKTVRGAGYVLTCDVDVISASASPSRD